MFIFDRQGKIVELPLNTLSKWSAVLRNIEMDRIFSLCKSIILAESQMYWEDGTFGDLNQQQLE